MWLAARNCCYAVLLLGWASGAQAAWVEEHSRFPFVIRADYRVENPTTILAELSEMQSELTDKLGVQPATEWIELYLFRDQRSFQEYVSRQFPGFESRRALFIQGRGPAMVLAYRGEKLGADLRHETTHALLRAHTARLPLWLDEGLAEYFELSPEQRDADKQHDPKLIAAMRKPEWPSLTKLERETDVKQFDQSDYVAARTWARYLIDGPSEVQIQLRAFLAEAADRDPKRTLRDRLSELNPDVEQAMRAHWQTPSPE
jgi:hypothetical protein